MEQLVIPEEWYELTLAYYLNDRGMSEFELHSYNLRQELTRQRELFKRGHITHAEYEQAYLFIDRQLKLLQPSAQSEARQVAPLLEYVGMLWEQMTLPKNRANYRAEGNFAGHVRRYILMRRITCGRWPRTILSTGCYPRQKTVLQKHCPRKFTI